MNSALPADNPTKAKWLRFDEKELVLAQLRQEELEKRQDGQSRHKIGDAFRSTRVWLLCLVYFGFVIGNYGLGFWLPQVIRETLTKNPVLIGWISVIPWLSGAVAMIVVGQHSDASGERRWHIAGSATLGAAAFAASAIPGISGVAGIVALTFATIGIMCAFSTFWPCPPAFSPGLPRRRGSPGSIQPAILRGTSARMLSAPSGMPPTALQHDAGAAGALGGGHHVGNCHLVRHQG